MGANPYNTNLEVRAGASGANGNGAARPRQMPADYAPGREALQALLAFSSIHAQIRRRKVYPQPNGVASAELWAPDEFVLDEVLHLVCERALAITGADGVALALLEDGEITCRASIGDLAPGPGARLNPNSGFSGACFRSGLIVRCDDAARDPRVDREACERMGVRSMVAVPLVTESGVIGLLEGFCSEAYGFNDSDVRSLNLLAELILAALRPEGDSRQHQSTADWVEEVPETRNPEPSAAENVPENGVAENVLENTEAQVQQVDAPLPSFETLRNALAPVTEDSRTAKSQESAEAEDAPPKTPGPQFLLSGYAYSKTATPKSHKRIWIALLLVLLALALSGGALWWWRGHHRMPFASTNSSPVAPLAATQVSVPPVAATENLPSEKDAGLTEVTGIRHWSSEDSSTVAIDLKDQVQYEAHRLTDPERIYFDLHDTGLGAELPRTIEVGDDLLVRIRIAQPTPGVTRVVMETKNSPNFSVSLEPNPYRLLVEIRRISAKPKNTAHIDLFAPMHREPLEQSAKNRAKRSAAGENAVMAKAGTWLAPPTEDATPTGRTPKFRIVLDAGHGGWDMGTVGRKGLLEKNLVLDIVARLGNLVESRLGGEVIYTRHDDTYISLENRTDLANRAQADIFLSVHANYSDYPSARGVETYYTNTYSSVHGRQPGAQETNVNWANVDIREKSQESRHFAALVQRELYHSLAAKDRALRDRGVREASYVVLTGTMMPAILAEVSFVSSPTDEMSLQSATYRQRIAEALYKGVANYASGLHRVNLASAAARPSGQ